MSGQSSAPEGSDEPTAPPRLQQAQKWWEAMWRPNSAGAQFCFFLCCVFSVYSAVSRSPFLLAPLVPAQPAAPFFSQHDPVADFFTGDTPALLKRAAASHASVLFFYAPWDSASQAARVEILQAAHVLSGQVDVLAINCWHVTGECRKKIKNIAAFPLVIVSLRHGRGVQYSGPLEAARLVRFVQRVLRPLKRLETAADLALLQAASTTIAVGYTPFVEGRPPASYFSLLRAALLSLEERPGADLAWAVVTNARAAARLRLHHPGGLAVVNWNGTTVLKQPPSGALTAELMKSYALMRRREMAGWLELPDSKSNTLRVVLSGGATLLVFDRRRPLAPAADLQAVSAVRRVWLDYNNCNSSEAVTKLGKIHHTIYKTLMRKEQQQVAACLRWTDSGHAPDTAAEPDRTHADGSSGQPDSEDRELNSGEGQGSETGEQSGQSDQQDQTSEPSQEESLSGQQESDSDQQESLSDQQEDSDYRAQSSKAAGSSTPPRDFIHPDPGLRDLVWQQSLSHCRGLLLDLQQHGQHVRGQRDQEQKSEEKVVPVNITGLQCATNRTLSIYLLDSVRHAALVRRLGLTPGGAGAVILDAEAESQYVLDGPVTTDSLSQFVADFTAGRLTRTLVSRASILESECSGDDDESCPSSAPEASVDSGFSSPHWDFETVPASDGKEDSDDVERTSDRDKPSAADDAASDGTCVKPSQVTSSDVTSQCDVSSHCDDVTANGDFSSEGLWSEAVRRPTVRPLVGPTELSSETFKHVALNSSEDVVVYFYSVGCGHCTAYYHVFLAAMRLFANSGLRFARIDGAANDLRWEFSLETFPTIMYLPAKRKSESRVFPADLPITLGYVLRFILANASSSVRHAFFYSQCDAACRATTAYKTRRQAALVRRRQLSGARRTLTRHTAELARLRRALLATARTELDDV
ncbi:uncharacterized protein LOC122367249 isoform X1 [Amphibalanus amphitrite]|uniref:uncharacterized protein LOC122367249 isoform X1 n=1 Tax=Amphibalanus amphitrite TaxID=1232801 RepID=UPI001C922BF0|nr:uncharacterized protein LOC122367249 isoform X1 [Amphibalanus amphitrite]XP_043196125.1 uncharacterized protein LOC122367249 isoform X1 [Amphibalanus amphitrite]XP_043196126.1 uncharacterized protein LOC122367249 isoform X1 [Amphibalanus amphitrite]XP_043196127.1 uncharacterized protein LOC122367249 isoform X1 [Amphibalanus amphitrite]